MKKFVIITDFAFQRTKIVPEKEHNGHMDTIDEKYKNKWKNVYSKNITHEKLIHLVSSYYEYRITGFHSPIEAKIWSAKYRITRLNVLIKEFEIVDRTKKWLFTQGKLDSFTGEAKKTESWLYQKSKLHPEYFI